MTRSTQPERTPRGQGDRLRSRLLDAALELVAEHGDPSAVTIRAVTRQAGVSPTAFYLHFATRDELLTALRERGFDAFRAAIGEAVVAAAEGTAADRLHAAGVAYLGFAQEQPSVYALIFPRTAPDDRVGRAAFEDLTGLVAAYLSEAGVEGADVDRLALGIWAGIHGFATLCHTEDMRWPSDAEFAVLLARAWLGPGPTTH